MKSYFKQNRVIYIVLFLFLVALFTITSNDKSSNWDLSLLPDDQKPFGTFLFDTLMTENFKEKYTKSDETFYQLKNSITQSKTVIVVSDNLNIKPDDIHEIKESVQQGDRFIIAANNFNQALCDSFDLTSRSFFSIKPFWEKDESDTEKSMLNLLDDHNLVFDFVEVEDGLINNYFEDPPSESKVILENRGHPIAFRMQEGSGSIDFCSSPYLFTNYFILSNSKATNYLLSNIHTDRVVSAFRYLKYEKSEESIFKNIYKNRALKSIFIILLVLFILFFAFGTKRKQRIIPVITPLKNASLEFAKLMGRMYFLRGNHRDLCLKKASYLKDYLAQSHFIQFADQDTEHLYQVIAAKTNVELQTVHKLFNRMEQIAKNKSNITEQELHYLIKMMDLFYKKQ